MHLHDRPILFFNGVAVKIEVHRTLLCQGALRVEGIELTAGSCIDAASADTRRTSACAGCILIEFDRAATSGEQGRHTNYCKAFENTTFHRGLPTKRVKRELFRRVMSRHPCSAQRQWITRGLR